MAFTISNQLDSRYKTVEIKVDGDSAAAEISSGFSFPPKCAVIGAWVDVTTLDEGVTLDLGTAGTSNDPDGFLDGVSVGTAGLVKGTMLGSGKTIGALLHVDESAGDLVGEPSIACGGDEVTYTPSEASTFRGSIYISYIDFSF